MRYELVPSVGALVRFAHTFQGVIMDSQILYNGRWVPREHFRAFVYNHGTEKLVNSYDEFMKMIASGLWFADRADIPKPIAKNDETHNVVQIKKRGRKCRNPQSV